MNLEQYLLQMKKTLAAEETLELNISLEENRIGIVIVGNDGADFEDWEIGKNLEEQLQKKSLKKIARIK